MHLVANGSWGGGEQYAYDLVDQLCRENWCEPIVVCRNNPVVVDNFVSLGIRLFKLKMNGYLDFRSVVALSNIIKDLNDDCVIHTHDFKRAFIALAARKMASVDKKIRVVMTRHLIRPAKNGFFEKFVYRNIDSILFVSQMALDVFLSTSPKIDNNKCSVVLSGIKDRQCDSEFLRNKYGIDDNEFVMMYHGRIVPEKGIEILINALPLLSDIPYRMVFVGDDTTEYVSGLKKIISEKSLDTKVIWTGYQKQIDRWIGGCNLGLLPTLAREAFGLSAVEYMMAGKTVVTTDNGAQKEYIQNGVTGILVPPSDSVQLSEAIATVYKNGSFTDIGINARKYYEQNLKFDIFFKKIIEVYIDNN